MVTFIGDAARATLQALDLGSPFILLGFLIAGLLHEFVGTDRIVAALGGRNWRSIIAASILGAPLPLCSCAVLPAATLLRRKGASREATMAFLISTPETGVDSIALTYGLLGPFMAIARPIAAVVTAMAAGFASLLEARRVPGDEPALDSAADPGEQPGDLASTSIELAGGPVDPAAPLRTRLMSALRYGFVTLVEDLAFWLAVAFVLTGLLQAALPVDFFASYVPPGLPSMLLMAFLGIPMYVCASESTPLAMALMAKGLDPGSALVFLLTGPATNAATLALVARLFGRRVAAICLGSVVAVAIGSGLLLNSIVNAGWIAIPIPSPGVDYAGDDPLRRLASFALVLIVGWRLQQKGIRSDLVELKRHAAALVALLRDMRESRAFATFAPRVAGVVAVLTILQSSIVVVRPGEQCAVRFLGRALDPLGPGIHLVPPWPSATRATIAVDAVRAMPIGFLADRAGYDPPAPAPAYAPSGRPATYPPIGATFDPSASIRVSEGSQFVTGDENVISVAAVIHYQIADAARFLFGADDPESLLRSVARAKLLEQLAHLPIDDVYASARAPTEAAVLGGLHDSEALQATGVRVVSVRLLYVHAPDAVHAAFRDVASAAEDRTTAQNKALVEQEGIVRIAASEAFQTVTGAEAEANERVEHSKGDSAFFSSVSGRIGASPGVTMTRLRIEAFERALAGKRKIIKPTARQAPGLEIWLTPSGEVEAAPSPTPPLQGSTDRDGGRE